MRALVDLLLPSLCDGCGVRASPPWCATCDVEARRLRPAVSCRRCAGPDLPGHGCWSATAPVRRTWALTRWTGSVARAVLQAKLAGRREVFTALGPRLADAVDEQPDAVVAVPSDPRRRRQRGLDHTAALAAAVAAPLGVPVVSALRTGIRLPDRGRAAVGERAALPPGAFVAGRRAATLSGAHVLLVDDLVTTGATLSAAAATLVAAGADMVDAGVVARAGAHPLGGR